MNNTNDNKDALLVGNSSAEPTKTATLSSLSSRLNLWNESDGALHPPALLAAESVSSAPGEDSDEQIIIFQESSSGGAFSSSSADLPSIGRTTTTTTTPRQLQQQPHHRGRRRARQSLFPRSASLDRLCDNDDIRTNNNTGDTANAAAASVPGRRCYCPISRSASDSELRALRIIGAGSTSTGKKTQTICDDNRVSPSSGVFQEQGVDDDNDNDIAKSFHITGSGSGNGGSSHDNIDNNSKVSNGDTNNSNSHKKKEPSFVAATAEMTKTGQRQRRRRKVVVVRKTTTETAQETRSDNRWGNKYYHPNNNRNKSTVLVFPTSVVVGIMLGIVVAFVAVSLRRSASEIAELRSTVLKLQSTVLELQSTVMIDLRSTSSTVAGEETVIKESNNRSNAAEVEQQTTTTTTTMEHVVEALVNLDKAVNQIESNIASTTTRQRTEEPFVNSRIIGNKRSASHATAAVTEKMTLNFDDRALTADFDRVRDGYHGLGFTNVWTGSPHMMMEENDCIDRSGLVHGRISYPTVAVNANGDPASIRAMRDDDDDNDDATKSSITVSSLVATPVGRNNVQLNVEGLRGSTIVRATIVTLRSTQDPTLIELEGFEDLTEIRLETVGGELVFEDCQCSPIVAFDDIVVYRTNHH